MENLDTLSGIKGIVDTIEAATGSGKIRLSTPIDGQAYATYNLMDAPPDLNVGHPVSCDIVKRPNGHSATSVRHS